MKSNNISHTDKLIKKAFYPSLVRAFVKENFDNGLIETMSNAGIFNKKHLYFVVGAYIHSKNAVLSVDMNTKDIL